ncbi:MAG: hypothetical protein DWQ34_00835 [Planctomycetota bacterium]|nr:MAG: hypothetical protein DWQ34_00835 [Planctomycetota bacterium]REK25614.1 MAG: hypothetical protein DWQ41_11815 [Planctomycetota bacterium]REK31675.1 MAG: hypothetical protein DWQ45_18870 [Planctomycetota bacterium]
MLRHSAFQLEQRDVVESAPIRWIGADPRSIRTSPRAGVWRMDHELCVNDARPNSSVNNPGQALPVHSLIPAGLLTDGLGVRCETRNMVRPL